MIVIKTPSELTDLANNRWANLISTKPSVALHLEGLNERERLFWEAKLNTHLHDCGCIVGALFSLTSIALMMLQLIQVSTLSAATLAMRLLETALAAFSFGFLGKVLGLLIAMLRLKGTCAKLLKRIADLDKDRPI